MNINRIKLCNFGAYFGEHIIEPAIDSSAHKKITIIGGMNGRGKTSILDAILLALYGNRALSARNHTKSYSQYLESLINHDVSKEIGASVELDFDVINENEKINLRIKRSWKTANIRVTDCLETWRNGQNDPFLAETWDNYVEELLPSGISGLFFFDGEKISDLAEADDTPFAIQNAIRSMLGLDVVDRLITDLNTITRRNRNKINNPQIQAAYSDLQDKRESLILKQNQINQELAQATVNSERIKELLRLKQEKFNNSGGPFAKSREGMLAAFDRIKEKHDDIKSEIVNLAGGALPLSLVLPLLKKVLNQSGYEEESNQARLALNILNQRNEQLRNCLRAKFNGSDLFLQVETIISHQENELRKLAAKQSFLGLSTLAQAQLIEFINHANHNSIKKAQELLNTEHQTEIKKENLERHLLVEINQADFSERLKEISNLNEQIDLLNLHRIQLEKNLTSVKYEIKLVENKLSKVANQLQKAEESERIVIYANASQKILRQFRERLTNSKITLLSNKIEEAFKFLSNKENLIKFISIDPDSLKITLLDRNNREVFKARLSSGERQMLAISILWGLAQASGKRIPIIIDTPMGRLDSSHRINFITRYLPNASHQVIVLSTDTEIVGSYLDNLEQYIGKKYLLSFDNTLHQTKIVEGYFPEQEEIAQ